MQEYNNYSFREFVEINRWRNIQAVVLIKEVENSGLTCYDFNLLKKSDNYPKKVRFITDDSDNIRIIFRGLRNNDRRFVLNSQGQILEAKNEDLEVINDNRSRNIILDLLNKINDTDFEEDNSRMDDLKSKIESFIKHFNNADWLNGNDPVGFQSDKQVAVST